MRATLPPMNAQEIEMKNEPGRERDLRWLFDLGLIMKAIDGTLEMAGALLVLFVSKAFVVRVAEFVTGGELAADPDDFIAITIRSLAHSFAIHPHYFIAFYLAVHGFVKVALVAGIFAKKKIAYPLFMLSLVVFGAYETYRGFARGENLLFALAVLDFLLLALAAYEYRRRYPKPQTSYSSSG